MAEDPRVRQLLEEALDSGFAPEEVCRAAGATELLPQVSQRLRRLRLLQAQLGTLFPQPDSLAPQGQAIDELPELPGHEVQALLGRGGMGVVYRARHLLLERVVAVKMLLSGAYATPEAKERFFREARAVAGLNHPNIIQVHDVGEIESQPYFTMEYVEGGSLTQKLAGTPQPARETAALVATLAEAVQVAHAGGIIHRDLKSANVLLTSDGIPKITDFGLARRLEGEGELTLSGVPMGTPSYMAPEQARGQRGAVGPAADIYSLGSILYEMLTGRPPFRAETPMATLQQVLTEEPVSPRRLNSQVPRDLETICLKCLSKEPQRRYASAQALAEDLRRFERGEPILARPLGRLGGLLRWARRRPTAAALTAALLITALLALALVGGGLWLSGQRLAAQQSAEQDLREAEEHLQRGQLNRARAALERARGRLGESNLPALRKRLQQAEGDLQHRVEEEEKNRKLLARLDAIRLNRAIIVAGLFNRAQSDRDYEKEFRAAGIAKVLEGPALVAARVKASPVRRALVAALDDWAVCTTDVKRRSWLLEVARAADPNPWRSQVRDPDPRAWEDRSKLLKLAETAPIADESVQLLVALGERLQNHGRDADAVAFLHRVQRAHPRDFYASYMLANALRSTDHNEEAVGYYRAALAVRPDAAIVWYHLGEALRQLGRNDEALDSLERCVRLAPLHGWGHAALGSVLRVKGRPEDAIKHLRTALLLGHPQPGMHTDLARALQDRQQWAEAIEHYREAVKLAPDKPGTHFDLGMALNSPGHQDEAIKQLQETVSLDPNWARAQACLGHILLERGRLDEAVEHLRRAVELVPRDNQAQAELRTALIRKGQLKESWEAWGKALAARPREHEAWFGYAELCLFLGHEGDYHRARRALLARFGACKDPTVCERTGRACLLLPGTKEEMEDAAALTSRAVAAGQKGNEFAYPYFVFAQGLADYRLGQYDNAIKRMRGEAAAAEYLGPCPRLVLAMALHQKKQKDQARKELAAALRSYDWDPVKADSRDRWIIHVLRREAEKLILPPPPEKSSPTQEPGSSDARKRAGAVRP